LPPAILRDHEEPFDGWCIFREVRGELGVALWHMVRDVDLWATTEPRDALFSPGAAVRRRDLLDAADAPRELAAALDVLAGLVAYPLEANAEAVSLACGRVARWAEQRKAHSTALAFGQGAALALPECSRAAVEVGRLAALRGDVPRAESWLRRAVGLARREPDRTTYALAWTELGDLFAGLHRDVRARRAYARAIRMARRAGASGVRGRALWGVGRLEIRAERYPEAGAAFHAARRSFPEGHPTRAAFMHDRAELAVRQGRGVDAAPALRRLLIAREEPADRLRTLALLALCAAQANNPTAVSEVWHPAETYLVLATPGEAVTLALLDLARAALLVGNRRLADVTTRRAEAMARQHGLACLSAHAAALLDRASASAQPAAS
jgi:tetratricopeptide (TPR) repeat protein